MQNYVFHHYKNAPSFHLVGLLCLLRTTLFEAAIKNVWTYILCLELESGRF